MSFYEKEAIFMLMVLISKFIYERHEKILSSNEYGDTTTWIVKLIEMHNQHHIESNETIEKSQKLFHFGNSISSFGSDSVMPKVKLPLKRTELKIEKLSKTH